MANFNSYNAQQLEQKKRVDQQQILPTAVKSRQITQTIINNTDQETISVSVLDNKFVNVASTISAKANPDYKVGVLPYMIAFFEGSVSVENQIPWGANIAVGDYTFVGPVAAPQLDGIGNDGNNLVIQTYLANNTGSTKTIIVVIQARTIVNQGE